MHSATRALAIALLGLTCCAYRDIAKNRFGSARCAKFQLGVASPVLFIKTPLFQLPPKQTSFNMMPSRVLLGLCLCLCELQVQGFAPILASRAVLQRHIPQHAKYGAHSSQNQQLGLASSKQLQQSRPSSAADRLSMQEGGSAKLSTTLFIVFAILLFVGVTAITLLGPSDPISGGRASGSQGTVKVTEDVLASADHVNIDVLARSSPLGCLESRSTLACVHMLYYACLCKGSLALIEEAIQLIDAQYRTFRSCSALHSNVRQLVIQLLHTRYYCVRAQNYYTWSSNKENIIVHCEARHMQALALAAAAVLKLDARRSAEETVTATCVLHTRFLGYIV
eukprot:1904-Heterococcus_DN1.PRE.5